MAPPLSTDRKSLLALRGVGPESEAESVRFYGRRVTKVGPEVKQGFFGLRGAPRNPKKLPPEGWGRLNKGCERRTRALPDVSGGGERHDRFGVVVGEGVVEPRIALVPANKRGIFVARLIEIFILLRMT